MLKNDKFRFSLQWGNNTAEKVQAGVLLEKLGKRKSDFIVLAITEYIQRHPEVVEPEASLNISVTYHPLQPNEQLMEEIRTLARKAIEEHLTEKGLPSAGGGILLINGGIPSEVPADINDQDLDAMVDGLKLFDI